MQVIEGIICEELPCSVTNIDPGDLYMAKRNSSWKLLTCKKVECISGFIIPVENFEYCFNLHECFKVY